MSLGYIPLFLVPETEDSDVIEYETSMQRAARMLNEDRIRQLNEKVRHLRIQLLQADIIGPDRQKRLPEAT